MGEYEYAFDPEVRAALARWPNVPAVGGWLSLTPRGEWRFHEQGLANEGGPGEAITHPGIVAFLGRNYAATPDGRWFCQNGPQRAFVTLEDSPWILKLDAQLQPRLHGGQAPNPPTAWVIDEQGHLYAALPQGLARVHDQDLAAVCTQLRLHDPASTARNTAGQSTATERAVDALLEVLIQAMAESPTADSEPVHLWAPDWRWPAAPLLQCPHAELPQRFGFVRRPRP